jgi:hypothetical protein
MNVTITSPVTNPRDLFIKVTRVSGTTDEFTVGFHEVIENLHLNHAIMGTEQFDLACNDNYVYTPKFAGLAYGGDSAAYLFFDCRVHGRYQVVLDLRKCRIEVSVN